MFMDSRILFDFSGGPTLGDTEETRVEVEEERERSVLRNDDKDLLRSVERRSPGGDRSSNKGNIKVSSKE